MKSIKIQETTHRDLKVYAATHGKEINSFADTIIQQGLRKRNRPKPMKFARLKK